ncbi:MAG: hypothetical protein QME05_03105 [Candidatus Margulisbacteria bacterium]|nr:hypothetical protein [Candidatus Margulisiibacteriota bacterium]
MKNYFSDPNQEVEMWKDAFYNELKKVSAPDLENYLNKEADQILKKYHIKCVPAKTIKSLELVSN